MGKFEKVVAICGSPRAEVPDQKSLTQKMLNTFLEGLAPPQVRVFFPHLMNISYCKGCLTCWFKTPCICDIDDDMGLIKEEIEKSDLLILASPVYVDGFSAQTKTVLDRSISLLDPLISIDEEGHCRHELLNPRQWSSVLISTCGFSELDNFDHIRNHYRAICRNLYWKNAGEILLPASALGFVPRKYEDKFQAITNAGRELMEKGEIAEETMNFISREIVSATQYRDFLNPFFKKLKQQ